MNGSSLTPITGKELRGIVNQNSAHMEFWNTALNVLRTIKFEDANSRTSIPPSVSNWMKTIQGFKALWNILQANAFKYLYARNINQDTLENFFSCVRSHGLRNINPSPYSFQSTFKILLVFMVSQSPGGNCEEDESEGALDTLRNFIISEDTPDSVENIALPIITPYSRAPDILEENIDHYIAGAVARYILRKVKGCQLCKSRLLTTQLIN